MCVYIVFLLNFWGLYVGVEMSYGTENHSIAFSANKVLFTLTVTISMSLYYSTLTQSGVDFLRLGSTLRVHPSIRPYTPGHVCSSLNTVQSIEGIYHSKPVVATTCLGVNHPIFTR